MLNIEDFPLAKEGALRKKLRNRERKSVVLGILGDIFLHVVEPSQKQVWFL
jgi:hypothetical protein